MRKAGIGVATVTLVILFAVVVESQTKLFHRTYADVVLDSKYHYIPCERLPTSAEVARVVVSHRDVVMLIEQAHPEQVGVEIDSSSCPGRADITIWYASHRDRLAIEEIVGADTFFGVPYNLVNR